MTPIHGKYCIVVGFGGIACFDTKEEAVKHEEEIIRATKYVFIFGVIGEIFLVGAVVLCS